MKMPVRSGSAAFKLSFLSYIRFSNRYTVPGTPDDATDKLEDHPRMGRRVPEADDRDDVRELIVQGYRIIYLLQTEQLQILTVLHGSRNLAGQENKPWEEG